MENRRGRPERQPNGRQTWVMAPANAGRQSHVRASTQAVVTKMNISGSQRPERLAVGVSQRTLSGKYRGITWAQSWDDAEMGGENQPEGNTRHAITEDQQSGTAGTATLTGSGTAASKIDRPSSADVMLRWAMQEQVESLAPTTSVIPFN